VTFLQFQALDAVVTDEKNFVMSEESKCEFCKATLMGFRELSRIEYGELEALAAKGCEACGCLLEATGYYQEECPNLYGMTLNTFGPFPPGRQPFILSRHGGRQSEKKYVLTFSLSVKRQGTEISSGKSPLVFRGSGR
jgi:hypothetical protein